MDATLTASRESTLRQRELMRHKRARNADLGRVFDNSNGLFGGSGLNSPDRNAYATELAYAHDRGEPHAAIRPIAQRIAGQPVHVAEVVNSRLGQGSGDAEIDRPDTDERNFGPGNKSWEAKAYRSPKSGRRRMSLQEMAKLPRWVRKRLGLPTDGTIGEVVEGIKSMHSNAVRVDLLEQHPVLDLLADPNPRMSGHTLLETSIVSLMFTGRCYWWIVKAKKRPYDLFYIPAHRVREEPNNVMLDQGYLVSPANAQGGDEIHIPAERMIYLYHPDPADPMKALAPIRACMQNVRVGEAITTSQEQTFNNGLFPALAFITGDIIAPDGKNMGKAQMERWQINELDARLKQLYQGPMKYGKHIVLDRVIDKVERITDKPMEMDWTESYDCNRDAIWRNIGTPRVIAGDINDANRATALVADESFTMNVCNPRCGMLSHMMNDRLLPLFNSAREDLIMWVEECNSADRDAKLKEITLLSSKRGFPVDEMRSEFGYPPLPNDKGKVLVSSATDIFEPLDDKDDEIVNYREDFIESQQPKPAAPAGGGGGGGSAKPPKKPKDPNAGDRPPPSADETATGKSLFLAETTGEHLNFPGEHSPVGEKDFETAWLKIHGRNEKVFARDVEKFLKAQCDYIVKQLKLHGTPASLPVPENFFNPREWDKGLKKLAHPNLLRCAVTGARNMQRSLKDQEPWEVKADEPGYDVLIDLPPRVVQAIKEFLRETLSKEYWNDINDTTAKLFANLMQKSLEAGESLQQLVGRVQQTLGGRAAGARGLTIARTETTGSLNGGARAVIDDLKLDGIIGGSEWWSARIESTRPAHWDAHEQKEGPDGLFDIGGEKARYPGDPNLSAAQRVHCLCTLISYRNNQNQE